jgi:hypothetical protein
MVAASMLAARRTNFMGNSLETPKRRQKLERAGLLNPSLNWTFL